ncbi:MAG: pilus assembly protein [Anaerolineae bacterium]|nr:pilus assembly protein [Anaerolineae bacterium]
MYKAKRAQSMVEFALVLPLLLLLLLGMVEAGYAFYDYMVVANANREGIRFASRGQGFTATQIAERVVVAGGQRQTQEGTFEPVLRTTGIDPNLGIIITYIDFDPASPNGIDVDTPTDGISGTIATADGTLRPVTWDDSRVWDEMVDDIGESTEMDTIINQIRQDSGYDINHNRLVVVETFLAHPLLLDVPDIVPFPNPMPVYFRSAMRVTVGSRSQ